MSGNKTRSAENQKTALANPSGPSNVGSKGDSVDSFYAVEPTNWYKTLPYGFAFSDRKSKDDGGGRSNSTIFYLPISPNNINVTTHFATNIVTTLYGVVEEHSEVRYYDIVISGTTGFAPQYNKEQNSSGADGSRADKKQPSSAETANFINPLGRTSFQNDSIDLGGFLPEVTNIISQANNLRTEIGDFLGGGPKNYTGISPYQNGYVAFHNFYRFLLKYKLDMAGKGVNGPVKRVSDAHPLQFLNYKDGVQYDCIPVDFTLMRSAESPMLYNYSIKLRCFNLRSVNAKAQEQGQLAKVGLGDIKSQSLFSSLSGAASSASTLLSGFL